jgi:dTDP-4-dehydrorhamnose reductase
MGEIKKKKVLILGAAGMLGHKLAQRYRDDYEVWVTVRSSYAGYARYGIFDSKNTIGGVDILNIDNAVSVIGDIKPGVVINCIGIIKQLKEAEDPILSLKINSLLPHQLANICRAAGARFFHISTDCVFDGKKGMYTEGDFSNATDLYGRTKYLGEVNRSGCLTLRTSIIGRELNTANGLVEWFLSNSGKKVRGFKKAIYTGFTTIALADIIKNIIDNLPDLSGLYQVSSEPIDKFSLLNIIKDKFKLDIEIEPETKTSIDRSLDSSKFRKTTCFTPLSWEEMIEEMARDKTSYDLWHK